MAICKSCRWLFLVAALILVGCNPSVQIDTSPANPAFSNLGGIAEIYTKYKAVNGGSPDESQLKQFGADRGGYSLDRLGVETMDELLVSKRDNQPFVILLGKSRLSHEGAKIIAHEAAGVDGTRMVALDSGGAELLTEEQFNAAK